jgi:hypothetical protein
MQNRFSRALLQQRVAATFSDPAAIQAQLADDETDLTDTLKQWLTRLMLLHGVPINYLVPDERMLPPESIRFFNLDMNWVDAMIDGAFSIGRNLTRDGDTASHMLDKAVAPLMRPQVNANAGAIRAKAFGVPAPLPSLQVITGFLLRSAVVTGYPGIGVNAYPQGGTPSDGVGQIVLLPILRLEQLGPQADTILCLIDGDAIQVDVHEPPEGLHYGVDKYSYASPTVKATKFIHTFTRGGDGSTISMSDTATSLPNFGTSFRTNSPRTLMMTAVANLITTANTTPANPTPGIDSAAMGFEMNQGVGQVSFKRK